MFSNYKIKQSVIEFQGKKTGLFDVKLWVIQGADILWKVQDISFSFKSKKNALVITANSSGACTFLCV